jgi:glycosyltransferase involved in cell wall biosynthesis
MKKKLHIHSENQFWAGDQNMPGIFIQNEIIKKKYDVTFSYRYSKEFNEGMSKWVNIYSVKRYPMHFFTSFLYKVREHFRPIMALKYFCMIDEIFSLYLLFKEIKPDILHINNGGYPATTSCNSAAIAGKIAGIKKITYMINSTTINNWWERPITFLVKKSVDEFVSASEKLLENSKFLLDFNKKHSFINWDVIPNTLKYKTPINKTYVREHYGIKDSETFILNLGNLEERKGQIYLLKTFEREIIGVKCLIKGSGPEHGKLISYKDNKNIKNVIIKTNSPFKHSKIMI